jgi:hypothetical protein
MLKFSTAVAILMAGVTSASAQGFTVINDRGGQVDRSRSVSNGELNRSVDRTTANGRTVGRDVSLERTSSGDVKRSVTSTGPRGVQRTRGATISRD